MARLSILILLFLKAEHLVVDGSKCPSCVDKDDCQDDVTSEECSSTNACCFAAKDSLHYIAKGCCTSDNKRSCHTWFKLQYSKSYDKVEVTCSMPWYVKDVVLPLVAGTAVLVIGILVTAILLLQRRRRTQCSTDKCAENCPEEKNAGDSDPSDADVNPISGEEMHAGPEVQGKLVPPGRSRRGGNRKVVSANWPRVSKKSKQGLELHESKPILKRVKELNMANP